MPEVPQSNYRWYILALLTAIGTFVSAIPFSCMPVLFKEISDDLDLSLVQIGTIWGIASLAGVFVSIIAGVLSDRFGVRNFLSISCILVGITGALRGLSDSFWTLALTVFINGIVRLMIPISVTKTIGIWFKGKNLGMAMGTGAMGIGFGLMLGPMISATVLSPLLGGWRNVLYLFGAISAGVGILWYIFGREPPQMDSPAISTDKAPFWQAFSKLIRNKALWLLGLTLFFRTGCLTGMTGYLPLYLRGQGWMPGSADGALASFYAASTISVVPLSSLSDRLGSRKVILFTALVVTIVCMGFLPFAGGMTVFVLMILSGIFMDGFMATFTTMIIETEGVGPMVSGTALGLVFTIAQFGSVISPPLGNSFASTNPALPFVFWAGLGVIALLPFIFTRETTSKRIRGILSRGT
jgi:MFS family permease